MTEFLIDPLKTGSGVITQVTVEDDAQIAALLCVPDGAPLTRLPVGPESWDIELVVAPPQYREDVRRLGEFRIMKPDGSYISHPGRGVITGHAGAASQLMGLLASSGMWVSA